MKISKLRAVYILCLVILSVLPVFSLVKGISSPFLDIYSAQVGDDVEVSGEGVTAGSIVNIYWDSVKDWNASTGAGLLGSTTAESDGGYSYEFEVPEAANGAHYVWVKDLYTGEAAVSDALIIISKTTATPNRELPGNTIDVEGKGFTEEEEITLMLLNSTWGMELPTSPSTPETDMLGSFSASFQVPDISYGEYTLWATDEFSVTATTNFTVTQQSQPLLLINEVLYDSVFETSRPQREWFEIYNPTSYTVDLYGYVIEDNVHRMYIDTHLSLAQFEYVIICNNVTAFREDYTGYQGKILEEVNTASTETDDPRDDGNLIPVSYGSFKHEDIYLNNGGDWLKLFSQDPGQDDLSGSDYIVDSVAWENLPDSYIFDQPKTSEVGTWNIEDAPDGYSIQRSINGQDTNDCDDDFILYPKGSLLEITTPGYTNTRAHEDLILEGSEKLVIEDCVYNHSGEIIVRDNASLILRNATLALYWPSFHKYDISFEDSSYFESFNSTITDTPSSCKEGGYYLFMKDSSFANITSSRFHYPAALLDARGQDVTIKILDSHLDYINIGYDSKVEINNSQIRVHIWRGSPDVTIRDCKNLDQILIQFTGSAYADLSLQPGYHSYWSLQGNETISNCTKELTVFNSTISNWSLHSWNQPDINVKDSTLSYICGRDEASFKLENVIMTQWISSEDNSSITLRDSSIRRLNTYDSSKVQMVNTSIDGEVNVFNQSEIYVGWYLDATAINEAGPIEGATVEVYTLPEATLIDNKLTDEEGLARFDLWEKILRANDTDFVNNYKIDCEYQEARLSKEIILTGNDELLFYFTGMHYSISGSVYFGSTPLDDILVELTRDGEETPILSTITSQGFYSFSEVAPGLYWVTAYGPTPEYRPYISYRVEVIDQDVTRDIDLPKLLTLLSPENDSYVSTSKPTFEWEGFPDAVRYSLSIHNVDNWTLNPIWEDTDSTTSHTLQTELSNGKEYGWSIYAYDINNHLIGSAWPWWSFKINTTTIFEINLYEGWNLVGIPCIPEDPSIEVMLQDIIGNVESVWTYDGETKTWSSWSPGAPSDLTEIRDGKGYWIKMTTDMVWEIEID